MCTSYSFVYLHLTKDERLKALSWAFPTNLPFPGRADRASGRVLHWGRTEASARLSGHVPRFCGKLVTDPALGASQTLCLLSRESPFGSQLLNNKEDAWSLQGRQSAISMRHWTEATGNGKDVFPTREGLGISPWHKAVLAGAPHRVCGRHMSLSACPPRFPCCLQCLCG